MKNKMFCYQCQETAGCTGCTMSGVCGKKPDVAAMQDLLVYTTKGLSAVTTAVRAEGGTISTNVNHLITLNLFTTITNANFDKEMIIARIRETLLIKDELLATLGDTSVRSGGSALERTRIRIRLQSSRRRSPFHGRRGYPEPSGTDHLRTERAVRLLQTRQRAAAG